MKKITLTLSLIIISVFVSFSQTIYSFSFGNSTYELVQDKLSWEDAASYAADNGGHLVHINSLDEQNAVYDAIVNGAQISDTYTTVLDGGGVAYIWIGATDKNNEDDWIWDGDNDGNGESFWSGNGDGSAVNNAYYNWGGTSDGTPNEPDDFFSNQDAAAIGLAVWPAVLENLGSASEWNDIDITNELYFIVEYDNNSINYYKPNNFDLRIYPNPAINAMYINSSEDVREINFINTTGEIVLNLFPISSNTFLNFELPSGLYIIEARMNDGRRASKRIFILN